MSSKRRRKKARVPGLIITIILLLLVAEFVGLLAITKLLPVYLLFAVGIVFMTCVLLVAMLTGNFRKKVRFIIGAILGVLLLAILLLGNLYVMSTYNTLNKISGVNTQTSQIGVYVLKDDSAQSIEDAKSYTFGTLSNLDTENTQAAVKQIEERTGQSVKTQEENGVTKLVDSLLDGSCDAIILNHAYLPVLEDMEGYADIEDKIRELDLLSVDVEIKTDDTASSDDTAKQTDPDNIIRLYISGIDTRGEMTAKSRSDVNIIATVNTDTHEILLVSTPRDYFVPLSISGGAPDKLTHAGIYGIDVCMDTLGMLYDIDINYYFRINFGGFVKVIDALGGITVNSDYDFDSKNILGYHFNKGENYVNGEQALIFARERYAFQEGDRQRGKNQMEVIRGVVKKALSPEILTSYSSILSSLDGCFGTNITYEEIAQILQQQLTNGGDWTIVSYSVNGTGATEKPYSMSQKAYVMVPDYNTVDKAKSLMEKVRNGEVVTQEEADAPVSGSTSTDSTSTETVTEPGTVAAETQAATDTTAADGTTTEGAADTTTQQ
mgnify:CR=1 FL=1